jgi:spore germination protein YaaH
MRALIFLLSTTLFASAQPKALFYMIETPNSVKSFIEHADKIDIIVPAWYHVDGNGLVWGGPNPQVMKAAAEHHVPVMPIVALMNQAELHKLLTTEASKLAFINALLS